MFQTLSRLTVLTSFSLLGIGCSAPIPLTVPDLTVKKAPSAAIDLVDGSAEIEIAAELQLRSGEYLVEGVPVEVGDGGNPLRATVQARLVASTSRDTTDINIEVKESSIVLESPISVVGIRVESFDVQGTEGTVNVDTIQSLRTLLLKSLLLSIMPSRHSDRSQLVETIRVSRAVVVFAKDAVVAVEGMELPMRDGSHVTLSNAVAELGIGGELETGKGVVGLHIVAGKTQWTESTKQNASIEQVDILGELAWTFSNGNLETVTRSPLRLNATGVSVRASRSIAFIPEFTADVEGDWSEGKTADRELSANDLAMNVQFNDGESSYASNLKVNRATLVFSGGSLMGVKSEDPVELDSLVVQQKLSDDRTMEITTDLLLESFAIGGGDELERLDWANLVVGDCIVRLLNRGKTVI